MRTLISGGRIIDPAGGRDGVGDLWLDGKRIAEDQSDRSGAADETIDATGLIVCPGLIDPRVRTGEPGFEEDETIATASAAAVAGGFAMIGGLSETRPPMDTQAATELVILQAKRARKARVVPIGAVTKGRGGEELAEIARIVDGGAVALSDGKRPIASPEVMRRALQYARMFGTALLHHPQSPELVEGGVMHEGLHSLRLGLAGMPRAAEEIMVRRDIALAELTGGRIHLMGLSSAGSVAEVRDAKARGLAVTCDTTPQHLLLTDGTLGGYDTNYLFNPPLRTETDRQALVAGVADGTIDILSSDHCPLAIEKKDAEIDQAPFGIVGLETLIPLCVEALIASGACDWPTLLARLTVGPADLLNYPSGRLQPGTRADVTLIDPTEEWTIDATAFASRSRNTPFDGRRVTGRVRRTIVDGETRFLFV